ncbi:hypothetical protein [Photorhabdus heterorhabditis]|uniref:Uncharacterized protein n=1 Tax=Photorhabdus heterorhabditis TaxID=880156 RepID=A0A5B0X8H0_9GAMM|nr:hypothetical protein [Photorhabdus heterorhabditis]KAA1195684.1 hypothetical protein F0L16_00730 [Photorhabdus heterorhabditis]MBS9440823.1 hypothetical protein [Photorhabdus heterorhabditis]
MKKIKTKTDPKTVRKNKVTRRYGRRFRPDLYRMMTVRIIGAFGKRKRPDVQATKLWRPAVRL